MLSQIAIASFLLLGRAAAQGAALTARATSSDAVEASSAPYRRTVYFDPSILDQKFHTDQIESEMDRQYANGRFAGRKGAAERRGFPPVPIAGDGKPDLDRLPSAADLQPLAEGLSSGRGPLYTVRALPTGGGEPARISRAATLKNTYRLMSALDFRAARIAGVSPDDAERIDEAIKRLQKAPARDARLARRGKVAAGFSVDEDDSADEGDDVDENEADPDVSAEPSPATEAAANFNAPYCQMVPDGGSCSPDQAIEKPFAPVTCPDGSPQNDDGSCPDDPSCVWVSIDQGPPEKQCDEGVASAAAPDETSPPRWCGSLTGKEVGFDAVDGYYCCDVITDILKEPLAGRRRGAGGAKSARIGAMVNVQDRPKWIKNCVAATPPPPYKPAPPGAGYSRTETVYPDGTVGVDGQNHTCTTIYSKPPGSPDNKIIFQCEDLEYSTRGGQKKQSKVASLGIDTNDWATRFQPIFKDLAVLIALHQQHAGRVAATARGAYAEGTCPSGTRAIHSSRVFAICSAQGRAGPFSQNPVKSARLSGLERYADNISRRLISSNTPRAYKAKLFLLRAQLYAAMAETVGQPRKARRLAEDLSPQPPPETAPVPEAPPASEPAPRSREERVRQVLKQGEQDMNDLENEMHRQIRERGNQ